MIDSFYFPRLNFKIVSYPQLTRLKNRNAKITNSFECNWVIIFLGPLLLERWNSTRLDPASWIEEVSRMMSEICLKTLWMWQTLTIYSFLVILISSKMSSYTCIYSLLDNKIISNNKTFWRVIAFLQFI